jgi:hypothetical protein
MFNKTSKYDAEVDGSVVSFISSSLGYIESMDVCFVYSRLSNFSAIRRLSPLPVTGLQI